MKKGNKMKQAILLVSILLGSSAANALSQVAPPQPPVTPVAENCQTRPPAEVPACIRRNSDAQVAYARALVDYNNQLKAAAVAEANRIKAEEHRKKLEEEAKKAEIAQKEQEEALRKIAAENDRRWTETDGARQKLEETNAKNKQSAGKYGIVGMGLMITSGAFLAKAMACSVPLSGCTPAAPLFYKAAAAFGVASIVAKLQENKLNKVSTNVCKTINKVSARDGLCGPEPKPYNPQNWPQNVSGTYNPETFDEEGNPRDDDDGNPKITDLPPYLYPKGPYDKEGTCVGKKEDCDEIAKYIPPGTDIKTLIKGPNGFASSKNPFKVDKNGNFIDKKTGKSFSSADFANEAAMVAAGMTPAEAKSLAGIMGSVNKDAAGGLSGSALASNGLDGSGDLGSFGAGGGGSSTIKVGENELNGALAGSGSDLAGSGGDREPASTEGLAKDFNGEPIGLAGNDIFKTVNRRYNLKVTQDSFLAP